MSPNLCTAAPRILRCRAFTLLELVVALAVAAIVASFALPSYRHQIARSHRAEAAAALYRAAQFVDTQPSGTALPAGLDQSPQSGVAVYRLRVLSGDESNGGYLIEAHPAETGPMRDDACGALTLDATGRRSSIPPGGELLVRADLCWRER